MSLFLLAAVVQSATNSPRFELRAPLPHLPPIMTDARLDGIGLAQQTARAHNLQARILWVDGTANLDRVSSDEKVESLVVAAKTAGFNTLVFDVKPIVGQTLYPSALTSKIETWRGQSLPSDFDPLAAMSRIAKAHQMPLYVSLNAFSEGHALFQLGPGYVQREWQTVLYEPLSFVRVGGGEFPLNVKPSGQPNLDDLCILTTVEALTPAEGAFAVTLDKFGIVVDGFEAPGTLEKIPTLPKNGFVAVGYGTGAQFLRTHAIPGLTRA